MVAKKSRQIGLLVLFAVIIAVGVYAFGDRRASSSSAVSSGAVSSSGETVWITRPDGAHQCAPGSGQSLDASAQQLKKAKVRVLGSRKGSDSKLHAQMCGILSGTTNMFEIPKEDLPKAIVLGFHQISPSQ